MPTDPKRFCMCLTPEAKADRTKAALLNEYRWPEGGNITVRFLEGDTKLQQRVEAVAKEWVTNDMAHLYLDFKPMNAGPTDVRIAFRAGAGSWSYLGTYCRQIAEPQ